MGGNDWYPMAHRRLRKSKWWRRASDLARARNIMLWGEAYDATPAGSLPDDDDELAEAAGFGMDVESFITHKPEIMAPWTLCSDGRWYHPTVCEVVLETWEKQSAKRRADAERKARSRTSIRANNADETPDKPPVTRDKPKVTPDKPDVTRDKADVTPEIAIQTDRQTDRDERVLTDSSSAEADDGGDVDLLGDVPPKPKPEPVREAFDAYNLLALELGLPIAKALNEARRKSLKARLREHGINGWTQALNEIRKSDFLQGKTDRWTGADLDFVLQAKSFQRLIEGFYSRKCGPQKPKEVDWQ